MKTNADFKESFNNQKYLYLFIALLLPYLLHPFKSSEVMGISILDIAFTLLIYVSLFTVQSSKKIPYVLLSIALVSQILTWGGYLYNAFFINIASQVVTCIFLVYIGAIILHRVITNEDVTSNTIFAALCTYLLMAMAWAFIYSMIHSLIPHSFYMNEKFFPAEPESRFLISNLYYFIYYSFCTVTTIGYGDIVPAVSLSRMCSSLEAMGGQLYLVVLMSRLVGMHINHQNRLRHLVDTLTQDKETFMIHKDKTK